MIREILLVHNNDEKKGREFEIEVGADLIFIQEKGDLENDMSLSFVSLPVEDWNRIKNFIDTQIKK